MSDTSDTFHRAFDDALLPRLQQLGFARTKLERTKPGLVVAAAERALGPQRRVTVMLWCEAAGTNPRFRFDVVEPLDGVECTRPLDLAVPWPDPAWPKPRSLDFSGKDFRPEAGLDRLERALTFLAGAFAATRARRPLQPGRGQPRTSRPKLCFMSAAQLASAFRVVVRSVLRTSFLRRLVLPARTPN
jgi:hypothetical protein